MTPVPTRRRVLGALASLAVTRGCAGLTGRRIPETGAIAFENDSADRQTASVTVTGPDGTTVFDDTLAAGPRRIASSEPVVTEPGAYDVWASVGPATARGRVAFPGPDVVGYVLVFYQAGDLTVLGPT
jgi:hypothetical protein